jgi:hypothetical protein
MPYSRHHWNPVAAARCHGTESRNARSAGGVAQARANRRHKFHWIVLKMREAQTFLATFKKDDAAMKTLAVISILALLTISGAAYTDQMLTSERQAGQRAN